MYGSEKLSREAAAACTRPQQPSEGSYAVDRNTAAKVISRTEHGLTVSIAAQGTALPPLRCLEWVTLHAKCIVIEHADAGHR